MRGIGSGVGLVLGAALLSARSADVEQQEAAARKERATAETWVLPGPGSVAVASPTRSRR